MGLTIEILRGNRNRALLSQGQLAACVFAHRWWSRGQEKFILMILRGFRTDLPTKTFAEGLY